jgi:undecaprenyl-diphosphatase
MPFWITIVLLGIVEGITEFLPVSSTGHLLIAERWLPHQTDLFNVVIQSGAVLAVLPLFPDRLHQFFFRWREAATRDYLLKIMVAFAITGAGGLILEKNHFKLPEELLPVAVALFVGGVLFVVVERWLCGKKLLDQVTWPIVIAVGLGQLIAAVFPGTSRSGVTILLALILGLNRVAAVEFTFLVGIPTMLAASGLKIFKALYHPADVPSEDWGMLALGFIVAAAVSFIAVKWLLRYVQTHTFVAFGWYRIVLAAFIGVLLLTSHQAPHQTVRVKPQSLHKAEFKANCFQQQGSGEDRVASKFLSQVSRCETFDQVG